MERQNELIIYKFLEFLLQESETNRQKNHLIKVSISDRSCCDHSLISERWTETIIGYKGCPKNAGTLNFKKFIDELTNLNFHSNNLNQKITKFRNQLQKSKIFG